MSYTHALGVTGIIPPCGCRQRQFPASWFQRLTLIFIWFGGAVPSAGRPHADLWVFLALVVHGMQNPVKFPGRFTAPSEESAGQNHLSCQPGTASSAPSLMAFIRFSSCLQSSEEKHEAFV